MMLHDTGAGAAPVETVVNALPRRLASRVSPDDAGLRRARVPAEARRDRADSGGHSSQRAPASTRRKLLDGLGLSDRPARANSIATRHDPRPTSVRRASRTLDLANRLVEADDVVAYAAPNFLAEVRKRTVNDPQFAAQWHLDNTGQNGGTALQDVRALGAWQHVGGGDRSIVIAIIDDGIDLDHPDLKANIWRNPKPRARDSHGRDFVDDSDPYNPRPKVFDPPFDDTDTNDIHGTPCAGVAAAVGNNKQGVTGIAWNCRLMAVKILAGPELAPNDRIADAIRYAATARRCPVVQLGCRQAPGHRERDRLRCLRAGGAAAGRSCARRLETDRESKIGFPSSNELVIAVGACNDDGVRSGYSNFGKGIDLVAPSDDDRVIRESRRPTSTCVARATAAARIATTSAARHRPRRSSPALPHSCCRQTRR